MSSNKIRKIVKIENQIVKNHVTEVKLLLAIETELKIR